MAAFRFGDFELDIDLRSLRNGEHPVRIGARALEILTCLVSRPGEMVSKEEIIQAVWPSTHVDENSLRVQLVAVRRAIYNGSSKPCIENIPGRGYRFVETVHRVEKAAADDLSVSKAFPSNLPLNLSRLIGRRQFVEECVTLLGDNRLVSIIGPGGIGKTAVAVEIARLQGVDDRAVIFVDLAVLSDEALVASHIATLLRTNVYSADPLPAILDAIGSRKILFLFDNCEHLIGRSATVVEQILSLTPSASVLATSREPLRIPSEIVRDLPGLAFPSETEDAPQTAEFAAVELFNERITMAGGHPLAGPDDFRHAAEIVRQLDGIPLAIELAAARAINLDLASLSLSLSNPLKVLRWGLRTAPARQKTLEATIDWSYELLSGDEQILLAHLSVFVGTFDYEAAAAVAPASLTRNSFENAIVGLRSKSLLSVSSSGKDLRLLQTTRAFADTKLQEGNFKDSCRNAHAIWVRDRLSKANTDWPVLQTAAWVHVYASLIQEVRAALAWMLELPITSLALEICASSHIFWSQFGLMDEQLAVLEKAIGDFEADLDISPLLEARLRSAYGAVLFHVKGPDFDARVIRQFSTAAAIAEKLGDNLEIVRAHSGVCAVLTTKGEYHEAEAVALRLESELGVVAAGATSRILAMNTHFLGEYDRMNALCEDALRQSVNAMGRTTTSGAGYDQRTVALMLMAKSAWIQGYSQRSLQLTEEAIAEAVNMDNAISQCLSLAVSACPVYLGTGDADAARHYISMLRDISAKHSLIRWHAWGEGFQLLLPEREASTEDIVKDLATTGLGARLETMVVLAGKKAGLGLVEFALQGNAGWCRAELLRIRGELLLQEFPDLAQGNFDQAYLLAERQGAKLWQLRSALSRARTTVGRRNADAKVLLKSVAQSFSEPLPDSEMAQINAVLAANGAKIG